MTTQTRVDAETGVLPQWSPLVLRGMTLLQATGLPYVMEPQWSPLVVSGMTFHDGGHAGISPQPKGARSW